MPPVTVVVPVWNEEKYLPGCISALKKQTDSNFRVIVIDNHSTDKSHQLCRKAGWDIHQQTQKGISAARDEGFRRADSDIIASTNADTQVPPDWISEIRKSFRDPRTVCVYGPVIFNKSSSLRYHLLNRLSLFLFGLSHILKNDHPIGENFAVRRSAFYQVGGFNRNLPTAEDVDLCYRVSQTGKIVYLPNLIAYTSSRRLDNENYHFFIHHLTNFFRLKFFGTASSDFKPYR